MIERNQISVKLLQLLLISYWQTCIFHPSLVHTSRIPYWFIIINGIKKPKQHTFRSEFFENEKCSWFVLFQDKKSTPRKHLHETVETLKKFNARRKLKVRYTLESIYILIFLIFFFNFFFYSVLLLLKIISGSRIPSWAQISAIWTVCLVQWINLFFLVSGCSDFTSTQWAFKTYYGLESELRYEPSIYQPIARWLSHFATEAGTGQYRVVVFVSGCYYGCSVQQQVDRLL